MKNDRIVKRVYVGECAGGRSVGHGPNEEGKERDRFWNDMDRTLESLLVPVLMYGSETMLWK